MSCPEKDAGSLGHVFRIFIKSVTPYRKNHSFFDKVFIDFSPVVIYNNKDMQVCMHIFENCDLADLYNLHF